VTKALQGGILINRNRESLTVRFFLGQGRVVVNGLFAVLLLISMSSVKKFYGRLSYKKNTYVGGVRAGQKSIKCACRCQEEGGNFIRSYFRVQARVKGNFQKKGPERKTWKLGMALMSMFGVCSGVH